MIPRARVPANAPASDTFCSSFFATSACPISMAAAPMASNTVRNRATTIAVTPFESFNGLTICLILFMSHHHLGLYVKWIRNPHHHREIGKEEIVEIGGLHRQVVRADRPLARHGKSHIRGIDPGVS